VQDWDVTALALPSGLRNPWRNGSSAGGYGLTGSGTLNDLVGTTGNPNIATRGFLVTNNTNYASKVRIDLNQNVPATATRDQVTGHVILGSTTPNACGTAFLESGTCITKPSVTVHGSDVVSVKLATATRAYNTSLEAAQWDAGSSSWIVPAQSSLLVYLVTDDIGLHAIGSDQTIGDGFANYNLFGTKLRRWGLNTGFGTEREATLYQEVKFLRHFKVVNVADINTVSLLVPFKPTPSPGSRDSVRAGELDKYGVPFFYEPANESPEPPAP
jgi:hypothetical protein